MTTLNDWFGSFRSAFYDRTASPLAGSFLLSWVVVNFKFFLIVFSEEALRTKLASIDALLFPNFWEGVLRNLAIPLGGSLFLIFVYPYPSQLVYRFWLARKKEMRDARDEIEKATLLTQEEGEDLRRRLFAEQKQHREQLRDLEAVTEGLRQQLANRTQPTQPPMLSDEGQTLYDRPLNGDSLREYSLREFPALPTSESLQQTLLTDISRAGIAHRLRTVGDLAHVVAKSFPALREYAVSRPDVFKFSTDYLTKALGFSFEEFREVHGFSEETRGALKRLGARDDLDKDAHLSPSKLEKIDSTIVPAGTSNARGREQSHYEQNAKNYFEAIVPPGMQRELLFEIAKRERVLYGELLGAAPSKEDSEAISTLHRGGLLRVMNTGGSDNVLEITPEGRRAASVLGRN